MFTEVSADVPLTIPNNISCQHAELKIDVEAEYVTLRFENNIFAQQLLMMLRMNNLLTMNLSTEPIDEDGPKTDGITDDDPLRNPPQEDKVKYKPSKGDREFIEDVFDRKIELYDAQRKFQSIVELAIAEDRHDRGQ